MKLRYSTLVLVLLLGVVGVTSPANAAVLDWTIDVEVNTVAIGTATSSGGTLVVLINQGDTIRFIVGLSSTTNLISYNSTLTADDPDEIDYQVTGSPQVNNLAGVNMNFAPLADPNAQLNDGTPGTGAIQSVGGSTGSTDLYFVEYVAPNGSGHNADIDFTISGTITSTGGVDSVAGTASVQLFNPVPEPASMLLLGSGLAVLTGFSRRRKQR